MTEKQLLDSRVGQKNLFFYKIFIRVLRPSHLPIPWVPGALGVGNWRITSI